MGIGSPSKCLGLWVVPKDGQRDCLAWVNGPRTMEKNNGSAVFLEEPNHLRSALGR